MRSGNHAALLLIAALCAFAAPARGAEAVVSVQFDGESYASQFASAVPGMNLVEYVRGDETVDNWTKLLAVRQWPEHREPAAAAAELARRLNEANPLARYRLLTKEDGQEALIDFLTWPQDGAYMEFNIFRYMKQPGSAGLVSYQFAYRFSETSPEAMETFKQQREHWIDLMIQATFPRAGN